MESLPTQDPISPETISLSRHPPPGGAKEQPGPSTGSPGSGQRPANKGFHYHLIFCLSLPTYHVMVRCYGIVTIWESRFDVLRLSLLRILKKELQGLLQKLGDKCV